MAAGMVRLRSHSAPAQSICTTAESDGAPTSSPAPPAACTALRAGRARSGASGACRRIARSACHGVCSTTGLHCATGNVAGLLQPEACVPHGPTVSADNALAPCYVPQRGAHATTSAYEQLTGSAPPGTTAMRPVRPPAGAPPAAARPAAAVALSGGAACGHAAAADSAASGRPDCCGVHPGSQRLAASSRLATIGAGPAAPCDPASGAELAAPCAGSLQTRALARMRRCAVRAYHPPAAAASCAQTVGRAGADGPRLVLQSTGHTVNW